MNGTRLKHYGWGREEEGMTAEEQAFVLGRYRAKFARDAFETKAVPGLEDDERPRVEARPGLAAPVLAPRRRGVGRDGHHLGTAALGARAAKMAADLAAEATRQHHHHHHKHHHQGRRMRNDFGWFFGGGPVLPAVALPLLVPLLRRRRRR